MPGQTNQQLPLERHSFRKEARQETELNVHAGPENMMPTHMLSIVSSTIMVTTCYYYMIMLIVVIIAMIRSMPGRIAGVSSPALAGASCHRAPCRPQASDVARGPQGQNSSEGDSLGSL